MKPLSTKLNRSLVLGICSASLLVSVACRDPNATVPTPASPNPSVSGGGENAGTAGTGKMSATDLGGRGSAAKGADTNRVPAAGFEGRTPQPFNPTPTASYGFMARNGDGGKIAGIDTNLASSGLGASSTPTTALNPSDRVELLKLGLFEEEANRAPAKAMGHYEKLVQIYDGQRADAATAIFRLAECSRKLGLTNEALQNYRRLTVEFAEMKDLATVARQNIAGLSGTTTPVGTTDVTTKVKEGENYFSTGLPGRTRANLMDAEPLAPGLVIGLERSPVELAELERNIAFLESKLKEGNDEEFASAVRIVFPSDKVLDEMERYVADTGRRFAESQVRAKNAEQSLGRLDKQREQLAEKVNAAEAASKAPLINSKQEPAREQLNALVPMLGQILSTIEQEKRAIREPAKLEAILAKAQSRLVSHRRGLLTSARLQADLARALPGQPAPEAHTKTTLEFLEKATTPEARSALIQIAFRDQKLDTLMAKLRSESVRTDEARAVEAVDGDNGSVAAASSALDHANKLRLEREQELVRSARLRLELSRNSKPKARLF